MKATARIENRYFLKFVHFFLQTSEINTSYQGIFFPSGTVLRYYNFYEESSYAGLSSNITAKPPATSSFSSRNRLSHTHTHSINF